MAAVRVGEEMGCPDWTHGGAVVAVQAAEELQGGEMLGLCSPGAAGCCSANGKLPYERGGAKAGAGGGDEAAEVPRSPVSPNRNVPWFAVGSTGGGEMAADWLGCSWCCCSPAGETSMSTYCAWAVTLGGMTVETAEGSTSNNPGA